LKKKKKLYEGNDKKLYETEEAEQLIFEFKDTLPSDDVEKKIIIKGKGTINNLIACHLFEYLEGFNIPTHFIRNLGNKEMLIRKLEMIPIEIHVHNFATGILCERLGLEDGKVFDYPINEYYLKNEALKNPMINDFHAVSLGYAKLDEINMIKRFSSKINAVLKSYFNRRGFKLIFFKLEFGRHKNKVVLGDELSLSTCTLWDMKTNEKYDHDLSHLTVSEIEKSYESLKTRIFQ